MSVFSLERDPFPPSPEGDFYFSTPALASRLEELRAALEAGHVVLADEAGSGKTTMLDRYATSMGDEARVVRIRGHEQRCAKALLDEVVAGLGLPTREPAAAELRDADTLLELLERRSEAVILAVDDADRLENGALEQLLYLARRWERFRVRFLIAGTPSLVDRLDELPEAEGLPGRVAMLDMPRFDVGQVGDYVHMRLFRAGLAGDSPFGHSLVTTLYEESGGLVGAIDPVARKLLDGTEMHSNDHRTAPARRWPLGLVAVAGLGVLLAVAVPESSTTVEESEARDTDRIFRSSVTLVPKRMPGERRRSASADTTAR